MSSSGWQVLMSDDLAYLPKYVQIMEALRRRIKDGTYAVGDPLPSEAKLIKEFGASRVTVVRALNEMQLRGEIEREHGRGSFVKAPPATGEDAQSRPGLAVLDRVESSEAVTVVEVGQQSAPPQVAAPLGLAVSGPVHLRRYVSVYDGIPSDLVSLWAPLDVAQAAGLDQAESLSAPVRRLLAGGSLRPVRVNERLSARRAAARETELLDLEDGAPVIDVRGTVVDATGRGLLVVEVVLPGSLHELEDSYPL